MVTTMATWYIQKDREAVMAAIRELAEQVRAEPGTLIYLAHEQGSGSLPPAAPGTVVFYEAYVDEAAFQAHLASKAFTTFLATYQSCFVADTHGNPFLMITALDRFAGFVRSPGEPHESAR